MLTAKDITTFCDDQGPPGANPYVPGQAPTTQFDLIPYDPAWPAAYERVAAQIRIALGGAVLELAHVGSTSVPGIDAKPVIDIDLTVADSGDELAYVPALEQQGFTLLRREPWWYGHRLLQLSDPRANVHVWSPECPEAARHLIFRDWLRAHAEERVRYLEAKQAAAEDTRSTGGDSNDYNSHKQAVIREIYGHAFATLGLE
jgi:GrpB-like predicted nucleotidyltransferase (UPF0157 family)